MSDTVKVQISQYYGDEDCHYGRVAPDATGAYVFDVPADQVTKWDNTQAARDAMNEELGTLYYERNLELARDRETIRLRTAAEQAQTAYEQHLKHIGQKGETP